MGACGGVLWSVGECCAVLWSVLLHVMVGHLNSKKSPQLQKSHLNPKKSEGRFLFLGPFCYKNVEKMFYQPQKVTLSPQKVKKVKKVKKQIIFYFFTYCVRKSHIDTYILW